MLLHRNMAYLLPSFVSVLLVSTSMATEILELSSSTKFIWKIDNFTKLNAHEGVYSDVFSVGASKWRAQIYPKGYRKVYDHLSLYLCPVDLEKSVHVKFSFAVTSQPNCDNTSMKEGDHKFETASRAHGWKKFMRLSELHDPDEGYIVNDTCIIAAVVSCRTTEELENILYSEFRSCKMKDDSWSHEG